MHNNQMCAAIRKSIERFLFLSRKIYGSEFQQQQQEPKKQRRRQPKPSQSKAEQITIDISVVSVRSLGIDANEVYYVNIAARIDGAHSVIDFRPNEISLHRIPAVHYPNRIRISISN